MNKQKFIECLRNPSQVKESDIAEIDQIVKSYPYFQGARALRAKIAKEKKLTDLSTKVASAAVYATDRALLKRYINDHLFFIDSKAQQTEKPKPKVAKKQEAPSNIGTAKPPVAKKAASKPVAKKKLVKPASKEAQRTQKPRVAEPQTPKPVDHSLDELIEEIYLDLENLKKSKARFQEMEKKLEEEEAVNAAIMKASSFEINEEEEVVTPPKKEPEAEIPEETQEIIEESKPQEVEEEAKKAEEETQKPKDTKKDTKPEKVIENKEVSEEVTSKVEDPLTEEEETVSEPSKKPEEQPLDEVQFAIDNNLPLNTPTEVIEKSKKEKESNSDSEAPKTKKATSKADSKAKTPEPESKEKSEPEEKSKPKSEEEPSDTLKVVRRRAGKVQSTKYEKRKTETESEEEKIIDEFITKSPSISKPSKESIDEKTKDLADKSTRFQADIATEYLAEIYVEQGKIDRAISIYEKLGLKFPEKKSFFATRIAELKEKGE